ncbi:MAG TPA: hypothetical protein VG456_20115 [Candidatus Sulfopaludibacter sp.]|jgi:hypothetical protein|nr:hypothetical protein [Candidatus Sulfopaludibacter sp.]
MTALETLLNGIVDYAGLYPPASLSLEETCANYAAYLHCGDAWMLNRLVLPLAKLRVGEGWRISLLVDEEPGPLPPQVETFETKLTHRLSLPTYCEAPLASIESGFAKIRTGGDTIPSSRQVAEFLHQGAARRIPFKATAGLHHPIRAVMHGFVNVFTAAVFAWHGADCELLVDILDDEAARDFEFHDNEMRWCGRPLTTAQIAEARREFAHSFGSCSFEEPLADLRALDLLT